MLCIYMNHLETIEPLPEEHFCLGPIMDRQQLEGDRIHVWLLQDRAPNSYK